MKRVPVRDFFIGEREPLVIMTGPCVIESEEHCLRAAESIKAIFKKHPHCRLIFKSSYDKANRSSIHTFRGVGLDEGLRILQKVRDTFDLPIVTDVHHVEEARAVGEVCELLQVPAFLCRQTDLVVAIAKTGRVVTIKKGQFLAPWDLKNVVEKILSVGNDKIVCIERGVSFGYNNLVSDFRSLPIMKRFGFPVCFDATHSVQLPGGLGNATGGEREFIPMLARAAIVAGANALFMESHPHPAAAKSDATSVLSFEELDMILTQVEALYELMGQFPS